MFTVTACDTHGTKVTDDYISFVTYVECALSCHNMTILDPNHNDGADVDCWVCCSRMVIDPDGVLDH